MNIPMVDLKEQYREIQEEVEEGIKKALEATQFILGPNVRALEEETADYLGVRHAISVASGTDALHLALRGAGIGPGDEVITTSFTFIATAEAISYVGATPVFVDIDPQTFNLDVRDVERAVNERTKAILPVHLFGQPADLAALKQLCEQHDLKLIEDCVQSFGARYGEQMTGAVGDAGCFSFFPSKNLGGYGDGGLITTSDDRLAEEIRVLRNHGSRERYHHSVIGYNSRLDELQAVILRVKLKHIDRYNEGRRRNAALYTKNLQVSGVQPPVEDGKGVHVYHQYTILSDRRDHLQQILGNEGIASAIYYPIPLHRQEVYRERFVQTSLPHTEETARRVLSLPMYPELRSEQVEGICQVIREAL